MSKPTESQNKNLPDLPEEEMSRYQRCSDDVVARHHMCAGCLKGQFYCRLFEKWRARHSPEY